MKKSSILSGVLFLIFILTACGGAVPVSTPTVDPSAVAAVVATMLAGVSTATPLPQPTATLTPEPSTVLPRSLYYLAQDANGISQIYRLSRDGVTITQITFESAGTIIFDVSPIDGTIAYIAQNSLITVNAYGENRRVLTQDSNTNIGFLLSLVWSPDGKTIVYGKRDVVIYSLDAGRSEILFAGSDTESKYPVSFSPDGTKLMIRRHVTPSAPEAQDVLIYDFASQTLTPITGGGMKHYPCFGNIIWNTSDTFFCSNHVLAGAVLPGLWLVNSTDGSVDTLVSSLTPPFLLVAAPHENVDGNLYYLYGEDDGTFYQGKHTPILSLMRSNEDGTTNRTMVRPETFNVEYALWTPDGDAALIIQNNGTNFASTNMVLVSMNPSLPVVTIMSDASNIGNLLRWGP